MLSCVIKQSYEKPNWRAARLKENTRGASRSSRNIAVLLFSSLFTVMAGVDQTKQISGNVVDETGLPVIGANIVETGTTNGTVTDYDGNFSLEVNSNASIQISYIGYVDQVINTSGTNYVEIILLEDQQLLDEVVVGLERWKNGP